MRKAAEPCDDVAVPERIIQRGVESGIMCIGTQAGEESDSARLIGQ